MKIEVSIGEVVDKITILQIKVIKISDKSKLVHIVKELNILTETLKLSNIPVPQELIEELKDINLQLWDAEDIIRACEINNDFNADFIKCARLDAELNDKRFLVKNKINNVCESTIKEQKSYAGLYSSN